ncbi:MAG: hypothetical protein OK455_08975, partial [Thaumarchaeota archaeon]|nr:hypothetical protein [Nitrososphaerota archaeon]
MKGSDKWGQGKGPRIEVVLGALVGISVLGVYVLYAVNGGFTSTARQGNVITISTTGVQCGSSVTPKLALTVEQDTNFSALSTGLCYNYYGEAPTGGGSVTDTLLFNYYNGTIVYPCGTSPEELVSSQISAVVDSSTGRILSLRMSNGSALNPRVPCDPNSSPVSVVSVQDVESTIPAVPQLNLTLAANAGARPITKLVANLTLDGGKQVFQFDVSQNARLLPGQA